MTLEKAMERMKSTPEIVAYQYHKQPRDYRDWYTDWQSNWKPELLVYFIRKSGPFRSSEEVCDYLIDHLKREEGWHTVLCRPRCSKATGNLRTIDMEPYALQEPVRSECFRRIFLDSEWSDVVSLSSLSEA